MFLICIAWYESSFYLTLRVKYTTVYVLTGECNNNSHQPKHELVVSASLDCTIHVTPLTFQHEKPQEHHVIREHLLPVTVIRYKHICEI